MLENTWALIVENDAHSLVAISSILRDLGVSFKRNTTGAKVLEQLRSMNPLPDVILLSIDLPHGDGFAVNRMIKSDPTLRRIPVIALGSVDTYSLRQQVRHAHFASYFCKPLPRRLFGGMLQRILKGEHIWEAYS